MLALELLALLMLGAVLAPDSALGRRLIHTPARALARMTPRRALLAVLGFAMLLTFLASGPEMIALFGMADLSMLADIAALALLAGATARFQAARTVAVRLVRHVRLIPRRARRRRQRVARPRPPPREDPVPGPGWAFA